jgi:pilus assembly protein CpaF
MSLRKRLGMHTDSNHPDNILKATDAVPDKEEQERKCRIHYKVIDQMDLSVLSQSDDDMLNLELDAAIGTIIQEEGLNLSEEDNHRLISEIKNEVMGLGPLEPLLADDSISEIMCNGYNNVFVERKGRLEKIGVRFRDDDHLMKIIDKIATNIGRRIDESSPMVDARLADGSRVNAIISPLAIDGPSLTIRKFSKDPLKVADLIKFGSISAQAARLMEGVVKARLNVIISGGTGSGKTTMLNVFSSFIPHDERIITIEDSAELQLQQDHVVRLETRPPNMEGHGEITIRDLVKNCLRMRPDRIVVGEVRSGEALDMMQAMSTGHDGSITTLHANSPRDCLSRLETLVAMGGLDISEKAIRRQIASAVHVIVQVARLTDGSRKVISFSEITGMEGNTITLQEIFKFEQTGVDQQGKVMGQFGPTGIRPAFSRKLKAYGFELDGNMFNH